MSTNAKTDKTIEAAAAAKAADKAKAAFATAAEKALKSVDGSATGLAAQTRRWIADVATIEANGYFRHAGFASFKAWLEDHISRHPELAKTQRAVTVQALAKAGASVRETQRVLADATGEKAPSVGTIAGDRAKVLDPFTGDEVKPDVDPITGAVLNRKPLTEAEKAKAARERAAKVPGQLERLVNVVGDASLLVSQADRDAMRKHLLAALAKLDAADKAKGNAAARKRSRNEGQNGRTGATQPAPVAQPAQPAPVAQPVAATPASPSWPRARYARACAETA